MTHRLASAFALLAVLPATALATNQHPDRLEYKAEKRALLTHPLEDAWTKETRPQALHPASTACWRGYIAHWRVKDGFLELTALEACGDAPLDVPKILPGKKLPLRATWFTGVLWLPKGSTAAIEHGSYLATFEDDLLLTFVEGKLEREAVVNTKSAAAAKRTPESLEAALAPLREKLRACITARGKEVPAEFPLRLVLAANGQPLVVEADEVPFRSQGCLQATLVVGAKFPAAEAQTDQVIRFSLREAAGK